MKQMPQIHKFMSVMPHTIGDDIPVKKAFEMMREYRIRHLPVLKGGKLVGVLTDRDVKLASSFKGADAMTVDEVMTLDPFTVVPEAPLDQVVAKMAEHKYGCAVVSQQNGKIVGIFTANDGLRVLGEQLDHFYKLPSADAEMRARQ